MGLINRTPYNALVDDDGSNLVGTVWNKALVASLLLNPIDAALYDTVVASTLTGAQNNWAPGLAGHTLVRWSGAADAAFTGLAGGVAGQRVTIKNTGALVATFAHQSGSSSAGNKLRNMATSGPTPIAPGGVITYAFDGTDWILTNHDQGGFIARAFAAGNYTGSGSMIWTVDAGDVITNVSLLKGKLLFFTVRVFVTTVGGTLSDQLIVTLPNGFTSVASVLFPARISDNGTLTFGVVRTTAGSNTAFVSRVDGANWAAATNGSGFDFAIALEVT